MSLVELFEERVRLVGKSEHLIEQKRPTANDLTCVSTTLALEPFPTRGIGDACEPERKGRRHIEGGRRGVRETHNALVALPSSVAQAFDVCGERPLAHRRELLGFRVEPDVASTDEDRDFLASRGHSHKGPVDSDGAVFATYGARTDEVRPPSVEVRERLRKGLQPIKKEGDLRVKALQALERS